MSTTKAQATRVIRFSKLYGSNQLYLECSGGDLYQTYQEGFINLSPDYGQSNVTVKPVLIASDSDIHISVTQWSIGNVDLTFNESTGDCTTAGFAGIFKKEPASGGNPSYLKVVGNFAGALGYLSSILKCKATISDVSATIMTIDAALPVDIRKISGNGYDIHIMPGGGFPLSIMPDNAKANQRCEPIVAISQGATPIDDAGAQSRQLSVVWERYAQTVAENGSVTSSWVTIDLTQPYGTVSDPDTVKVPKAKVRGNWRQIVVPSGAVDSQLLIRATLKNNAGEILATDTATIYDNTDPYVIVPNPSRGEIFQIGNAELEADIEYEPQVWQGDRNETSKFDLSCTIQGSAGEVLPQGPSSITGLPPFKITLAMAKQVNTELLVTIIAEMKTPAS